MSIVTTSVESLRERFRCSETRLRSADDHCSPFAISTRSWIRKRSRISKKLNEVLWPHWNTLWRVCARGHYAVHRKPLRPKPAGDDDDFEAPNAARALPSQEEGGYRLDLVREEGNDFSPYLHFPGPLAPRYPVNGYARTAEFRRMLEGLDLTRPLAQWKGHYFYAHVGIMEKPRVRCEFLCL